MNRTQLKILLSKVEGFEKPKVKLEQYLTPIELAADIVYTAYMQGDIQGQKIVDLGAGTGLLSIGASKLGGRVYAVETDENAVEILQKNIEKFKQDITIINKDISDFDEKCDTVLMNPPFSVHSDSLIEFWDKATDIADNVYGLCPSNSTNKVIDLVEKKDLNVRTFQRYNVELPNTYGFHTEERREVEVDLILTDK